MVEGCPTDVHYNQHGSAACRPSFLALAILTSPDAARTILITLPRVVVEELQAFRVRRPDLRQALLQLSLHVIEGAIRPRKDCLDGLPILGEYSNADAY